MSSRDRDHRRSRSRDRSRNRNRERRDRDRDRDRERDHYSPPPAPREFTGQTDSHHRDYEFSFSHDRRPPADTYRPGQTGDNHPDSLRPSDGGTYYPSPRPKTRGRGAARGRGSYRGRNWVPPLAAHERPILSFDVREKTPELMEGMTTSGLVAVSEGEEEPSEGGEQDMDLSDSDKSSESDNEEKKPSADKDIELFAESEKKRTNVIDMIRKAKAKAAKDEAKRDTVAANDDFISLSFGDDKPSEPERLEDEESSDEEYPRGKMRRLNDGTRETAGRPFSHKEHHYAQLSDEEDPQGDVDGPPPGLGKKKREEARQERKRLAREGDYDPEALLDHPDVPKGRKRTYSGITGRDGKGRVLDGDILPMFRAKTGVDPAPWVRLGADHSRSMYMQQWLHEEITDFITYIEPRAYEHAVRRDLIQRIRELVTNRWHDSDVRVFGSFAAELYLPTSDLDLVIISRSFVERDMPKYNLKKSLHIVASILRDAGIPKHGQVQVVAGARVPIIKFVDDATNLNVDISFENSSGLVANEMFRAWKTMYPAMPILLTVMKHFLSIRGLNEVYAGGLGSFSITCLIVSLLQHLPSVQSGKIDPRKHLGVILLEFLDLYGKRFSTAHVGIRPDPKNPGYFPKEQVFPPGGRNFKPYLLCIQDPNTPDNDISKSSFLIPLILKTFSEACDALTDQMTKLDKTPFKEREGRSILSVVIGADYSYFDEQRARLKQVYKDRIGDGKDLDAMDPKPPKPAPKPLPSEIPPFPGKRVHGLVVKESVTPDNNDDEAKDGHKKGTDEKEAPSTKDVPDNKDVSEKKDVPVIDISEDGADEDDSVSDSDSRVRKKPRRTNSSGGTQDDPISLD